jgi:hypothetical protein
MRKIEEVQMKFSIGEQYSIFTNTRNAKKKIHIVVRKTLPYHKSLDVWKDKLKQLKFENRVNFNYVKKYKPRKILVQGFFLKNRCIQVLTFI